MNEQSKSIEMEPSGIRNNKDHSSQGQIRERWNKIIVLRLNGRLIATSDISNI